MEYLNNQYIRLDISISDIIRIKVEVDDDNKAIEDIDIIEDNPNIIIAYGENVDYYNIYSSVKILITDEKAFMKNNGMIPENIEKIIVHGEMYENNRIDKNKLRNTFELMNECIKGNSETALEILESMEINVKQVDNYGNTILMWMGCQNDEILVEKLLEISRININNVNKDGDTALTIACSNKKTSIALRLLKIPELDVNKCGGKKFTALIWSCINKMVS